MPVKEYLLRAFWKKLGAHFESMQHGEEIVSFSGVQPEYEAVRKTTGLVDLSRRGKIKVSGGDRIRVLHNILSNDIKRLTPGESCHAALLSATAKVLADMQVIAFPDFILLDVEEGFDTHHAALLEKYVITEDVSFEIMTDRLCHITIQGPESPAVIKRLISNPKNLPEKGTHQNVLITGIETTLLCCTHTGEMGYDFLVSAEHAETLIKEMLAAGEEKGPPKGEAIGEKKGPPKGEAIGKKKGLKPVGSLAREMLRIEAGILRYGRDFDEETLLPETGMEDTAASESKGCYPGQEVVAKIKTYKRLNRKITGLLLEGGLLPTRGDLICGENQADIIGHITSSSYSLALQKNIALGLLKIPFYQTSSKIKILSRNQVIGAQTTFLPFVKSSIEL